MIRSAFGAREGKRYRPPRDDEEREWVRKFAEAGMELRFEVAEPGEHRLIFWGTVQEEPEENS